MLHAFNNPSQYASHSHIQETLARELLETYFFRGHERVLDVGCGDGRLTQLLCGKFPFGQIVGLDISSEMINYAREHNRSSQVEFVQGDITTYKTSPPFDVVYSFNTLQWIPNQEKALANIHDMLKEGGTAIFLIFPPFVHQKLLFDSVHGTMHSRQWKKYFDKYRTVAQMTIGSPYEYMQVLASQGFDVATSKAQERTLVFSKKTLIQDLATWLPEALHLERDLRENFATDVVDRILKATNQEHASPGNIQVKMFPWVVKAASLALEKKPVIKPYWG